MEKDYGKKIILNFLNVGLVFIILYFLSICFVSIFPRPFLSLYGIYDAKYDVNFDFNYMYVIGAGLIDIIYFLLYFYLKMKIKNDKKVSLLFNVLIGISVFVLYYGITFVFGRLYSYIGYLSNDDTFSFVCLQTLGSAYGIFRIFIFISVILLLCAHVMYWFRMRYYFINSEENNVQ